MIARAGRGAHGRCGSGRGALVLLGVGAAALYGLAPQIFDLWEQVPRLRALGWAGLVAMVGCELASFVCAWGLHRVALPGLSWFAAGTTQLSSNAVSRAVPGGVAMGAGVSVKMWTIAGVDLGNAAGALAATSLISTATLFLLPFVALCVAAFGAPIPRNLALVAGGAGVPRGVAVRRRDPSDRERPGRWRSRLGSQPV